MPLSGDAFILIRLTLNKVKDANVKFGEAKLGKGSLERI
jgi:hypothetical protein